MCLCMMIGIKQALAVIYNNQFEVCCKLQVLPLHCGILCMGDESCYCLMYCTEVHSPPI